MIIVLSFGTGFIQYLPVPILTAIVISALLSATEFELAVRLWKINRQEWLIFFGAFFGVLMLGTINGVLIGMMLSFAEMIIRSAKPYRSFLGLQPSHNEFISLNAPHHVHQIEGVIIYRFSSSLFFANVDILQKELEDAIQPNTKAVILDASGIGSIDTTAADRLSLLYEKLKKQNIRFYMTEHISALNDQLRNLGIGYMIEEGAVRRTIPICLRDMGLKEPYPLVGEVEPETETNYIRQQMESRIQEFSWAYGSRTEAVLEQQIRQQVERLKISHDVKELLRGNWHYTGAVDEDNWIVHLEEHIKEIVQASGKDEESILEQMEHSREEIHHRLIAEEPELAEFFEKRREVLNHELEEKHPDLYSHIQDVRHHIEEKQHANE